MYGLGINCYSHNSSASLLKNGEILFSAEEERYDRIKYSQKFPRQAILAGLQHCGIEPGEIEYVTYYFKPYLELTKNLTHALTYFPSSLQLFTAKGGSDLSFLKRQRLQAGLGQTCRDEIGVNLPVQYIEHHLAHAASVFYPSNFDESAILTWDGRGESDTVLISHGQGHKINKIQSIKTPHSIGHLYSAITAHLGFTPFHDEWKVMGMSAYGSDKYLKKFRQLVTCDDQGHFRIDLSYFSFHFKGASEWTNQKFQNQFGPTRFARDEILQSHFDLAFALQKTTEEIGVKLARFVEKLKLSRNLCMTGGVALNVLLNKKIIEQTDFKDYFIQPVATDAGTSFGSALYYYHHVLNKTDRQPFKTPYLGSQFTDAEIEQEILKRKMTYTKPENKARVTAQAIADNKVVGWFQGRQECGPRALGNRSILANPTRPEMKDLLNARVKRREHFRPFAPSVLEEKCHDYFIMPKSLLSPYMILSGEVKDHIKPLLPAVTHVDGTARVHTVCKATNPEYWDVIHEFGELSGVSVVLNTSFNENEPIVTTPAEALDCFQRTKIDFICIGSFCIEKNSVEG